MVIINRKKKEEKQIELTVPWDTLSNMAAALQRKTERYEDKRVCECKKQRGSRTAVPWLESQQGQLCDEQLQQAGPPWLLHHLERKILTRLERRWLPKALKSIIIISDTVTITNLCIYFA